MPALVMRTPTGQPARADVAPRGAAADRLRRASAACRGASPSRVTYARDLGMTFQYSSFGVPGLGLRRGLGDDIVDRAVRERARGACSIRAPHCENLRALAAQGGDGEYGFYESIDYTPRVCPRARRAKWCACTWRIIRRWRSSRSANALHRGRMQDRFHAEPMVRADRAAAAGAHAARCAGGAAARGRESSPSRTFANSCRRARAILDTPQTARAAHAAAVATGATP